MAVNISGLRRSIMNVAHNYTDAQVKVREATSNDPWGPSSTMMSEISDLTYSVVAFSEIMQMIWKRLNDSGKNWRHVYKALVLLEYLIKTGSEKVAQQCMENIFVIQTLKDFQYLDDNKDQGINVREKAKALVALLKDEEKLKNERSRALKAKERFSHSTAGIGSDTVYNSSRDRYRDPSSEHGASPTSERVSSELESARPQTVGEEELQLQLALAMSREEAEHEDSKTKSDDMRLQLALQKSKELKLDDKKSEKSLNGGNALMDLADLNFGNPVGEQLSLSQQPPPPMRTSASMDPWGEDPWTGGASGGATSVVSETQQPLANDPWSPVRHKPSSPLESQQLSSNNDPWNSSADDGADENPNKPINNDPWNPSTSDIRTITPDMFSSTAQNQMAEFDLLRDQMEERIPSCSPNGTLSPNPFDLSGMDSSLSKSESGGGVKPKKTVESLLGEHSNLVNLDNLVSADNTQVRNPFQQMPPNPFQAAKAPKPAMNQLLQHNWNSSPQPPPPQNSSEFNPFF